MKQPKGKTESDELPEHRRCAVCRHIRRVIAKVGPLLIKEPCPNGCGSGYAKPVPQRLRP